MPLLREGYGYIILPMDPLIGAMGGIFCSPPQQGRRGRLRRDDVVGSLALPEHWDYR